MLTESERQMYLRYKQQVLPFDFWEKEKEEKEKKQAELINSLPHFENPKNDNEKLLELQWQYKHGDKKAFISLYAESVKICKKFINAIGKKNPYISQLARELKQIKAEDATTYVIEQYIKSPDFVIRKNFPGYLFLRVLHELYYRRHVDKIVAFVDIKTLYKDDYKNLDDVVKYLFETDEISPEEKELRELKQFCSWKEKRRNKC